jgi:diguanylate cyclase (GGDEF)-like protein
VAHFLPVIQAGRQTVTALLNYIVAVEPDRQRLARFALQAVTALGGNAFAAAGALDPLLAALREQAARLKRPIEVRLDLADDTLRLAWEEHQDPLAVLPQAPAAPTLEALARELREASEAADSALLIQRNRQISADLERARERARAEMAELEAMLEKKKEELQETLHRAETDSLTGLYNRGAYDRRLHEAFLRSRRQHEALCLILLDLDKFKEINDTHGHQYGDQYLCRMADAMRASIRQDVDLPCRMGGDEFAIIVFAELAIAERVAGKVLQRMDRRASIGIARLHPDDGVETLVARADAALYEAKHRGRGRFVSATAALPLAVHAS